MSDIPETDLTPHLDALEETGVGFNPGAQHLDLSKEEKRRTTALLMAITAYEKLIIKDAAYLSASLDAVRRNEMPPLTPASIDAMVMAAIKFDSFIAGEAPHQVEIHWRMADADPEEGRPADETTQEEGKPL